MVAKGNIPAVVINGKSATFQKSKVPLNNRDVHEGTLSILILIRVLDSIIMTFIPHLKQSQLFCRSKAQFKANPSWELFAEKNSSIG